MTVPTIPDEPRLLFADLKAWLNALITAPGTDYPAPPSGTGTATMIQPGPATDADLQVTNPGPVIFLTIGAGPGLTNDGALDNVFIEANVIGDQGDPVIGYSSAEAVALWLDRQLLAFAGTGSTINGKLITDIDRVGGRPALAGRDAGRRYHFQCSYLAGTDSGI